MSISVGWERCERGNVLLDFEDSEGFNAWLRSETEDEWLEISYRPENYPALNVALVPITPRANPSKE